MMYALFVSLISQNLFAKAFGGASYDGAGSVIQTSDGGYVVAGDTRSFGAGNYDLLVLKVDPSGNPIWARTFGGGNDDRAHSVIQTSDGGYVVAGATASFGAGNYDLLVLKLDASGNLSWAKTFGGADADHVRSVAQTSDGGYVIAGYTYSFGSRYGDGLVLKLEANGDLSWAKTFGGNQCDRASSVIQTSDGGYIVAAETMSFGAGDYDFLVLKLDPSENLSWAKTFGGASTDHLSSLTQSSDGGYIVAGETWSFGVGSADFLVLKLDASGNISWARTFGGPDHDSLHSVIQSSDGGYIVAGETESFGAGRNDFLVLKMDENGDLSWARTFGGTDYDRSQSLIQGSDGGYVVVGSTRSFGTGSYDLLVLKMDENGDYTDCVETCTPVVNTPSLSVFSVSVGVDCTPVVNTPNLTVNIPTLSISDACLPLYGNTNESMNPGPSRISCSPVPGGVLFLADQAMDMRIYSVDGRLVHSLKLKQGQNRVSLDRGVYLWQAGAYKGKAVVR